MTDRDERIVTNPGTAIERSDVDVKLIGIVALGVVLFVSLAPFILTRIYHRALGDVRRTLDIHPPAPMLQLNPPADLAKFRAREDDQLDSYGWVDRAKGIVHIPIEQAMKDVAARGLPDFAKAAP